MGILKIFGRGIKTFLSGYGNWFMLFAGWAIFFSILILIAWAITRTLSL
jgi:hypothetical protein